MFYKNVTEVTKGNTRTFVTKKNMTSRTWAFTDYDVSEARQKFWTDMDSKYMCFGVETCPTTGKQHLQGWITMNRAYRLKALKKILGNIHLEKGKTKDGMNYCMKEGNYTIVDNRKQGKRNDLENIKNMIDEKKSLKNIAQEYPGQWIRYHHGIKSLYTTLKQGEPRIRAPRVTWIHGPSGAGKTRWVHDRHDELWITSKTLNWFDGYMGQEAALLDDLSADNVEWKWLLRLLDRYPLRVPIKGGFTEWSPDYIYITCINRPEVEFMDQKEPIEQLLRRITEIVDVENYVDSDEEM